MCGILGQFAWQPSSTGGSDLTDLLRSLAHRGPDGEGQWRAPRFFLGHRRLAILDLELGAQPMEAPELGLAVAFNGEIYNYLELRAELEGAGALFRTRSDTEVLLHGYRAWGERLPERLAGMFAFAVADTRNNSLFLARDRFGEKPLFLREENGSLLFASEARPLLRLPGRKNTLNRRSLARFLCLNYVPGSATLAAEVERLPPGTWRHYGAQGARRSGKFWRPPAEAAAPAAGPHCDLARFRELFDKSVALTLRADVPVGIFLSGGIDSSLVAESAVRQGLSSHAYCLDFGEPGFSEAAQATFAARRLGLPLTTVPFDAGVLAEFLEILRHSSDPLADSSQLPLWALARAAARSHKVALSGDGGDELFGGYLTYKASLLHSRLRALPAALRVPLAAGAGLLPVSEGKVSLTFKLARFLRALPLPTREAHFTWNGSWLPAEAVSLCADPELRRELEHVLPDLAAELGIPENPSLLDLQVADCAGYLPDDILAKSDRMTMAHGLELRSPFLGHELAEFALSLPDRRKIGPGGATKALLREAAAGVYGSRLAQAPKQGFSIPIHRWLRGAGRELVELWLSPQRLQRLGFLDGPAVRRMIEAHFSRRRSLGFELWGLMVLSQWHQEYLE